MKLTRIWFATGVALLLHSSPSPAETARATKVFCWKATSATTEVYLMGSIHLGKKEWYPLAPEIEAGFEKSKYLVVEADEAKTDMTKLQQFVFAKGMYPQGDSLAAHVPAELAKGVTELGEKLGMPAGTFERMKPWLISITASVMSMQKLGYSPEFGVDRHFTSAAKEKGKEILELESMEMQLNLLSGFSDELQVKFLSSTLEEQGKTKESMEALVEAWSKGDADAIEQKTIKEPLAKHPDYAPMQAKLIDDRNAGMATKIGEYLKSKDAYFVVVGAAHLVGDKGVVRLLEKQGFKLTQFETAR